jgi:hypothetical protein
MISINPVIHIMPLLSLSLPSTMSAALKKAVATKLAGGGVIVNIVGKSTADAGFDGVYIFADGFDVCVLLWKL